VISRTVEALGRSYKFLSQLLQTRSPRLVYAGGFLGYRNLGDEALFQAYKKLFEGRDLFHYPCPGGRVLSISSKLIRFADHAVLAGGTLINHRDSLGVAQECVSVFPKFFVFGTGVACPDFWSGANGWKNTLEQWKGILRECHYIGIRGPISANILRKAGIDNVDVIGDPILALASESLKNGGLYRPDSVGLNVGWDKLAQWGEPERIYTEFIKLVNLARKAGWEVKWFVLWPPDLAITRKLAIATNTEDEIYEVYTDVFKYLDQVRYLSTFVGTRLHSVALATCAYVPSIMLEYRPKCRDYMASIGLEDWTLRTDRFRADEVWDKLKSWNGQRRKLSELLFQKILPLKDKQREKADVLMEIART